MSNVRAVALWVGRSGKRIGVTLVGVVLVCTGLALLVLPGPGILVIVAGFAVLGTEYAWARHALTEARRRATEAADKVRRNGKPRAAA